MIWWLLLLTGFVIAMYYALRWSIRQDRGGEVQQFKEGIEGFLKDPLHFMKGNGHGK